LLQLRRFGEPRRNFFGLPNQTAEEMLFHEYMGVFREAARESLAHVERKIPLKPGVTRWPLDPNEVALKKRVGTYDEFCGLLYDLHDTWGGEVYVDGFRCFGDSVADW